MKIMHNIRVDLTRRENIPQIYVSQNDSQSRYVKAFLFDGAVPFLVPEGVSASLAFKKPDRTGGWYDEMPDGSVAASAEGNQITIALIDEIFQVAGKVSASIVLRNGNLEQLAVFPFAINVVENPTANQQISNSYYKIRSLADLNLALDEKMDKGKADRPLNMAGNSIFGIGGGLEIVQPGDNEGVLISAKREIDENGGIKEASIRFEETTADGAVTLKNIADGVENSDAATVGQLNAAIHPVTDEKYFSIDYDGVVSLKTKYQADGSNNAELPEIIVIPDVIDGTAVSGLQASMFLNNLRVKEITIPDGVTELPDKFCSGAKNLSAIHNTEQVTKLGMRVVLNAPIKKAIFPNLKEVADGALAQATSLYLADIGDNITEIPYGMFRACTRLSLVKGGGSVKTIGKEAFYLTHNLKNLPFLSQVTAIGERAFLKSRIQFDWSTIEDQCEFATYAVPVLDNTTDYWTGVEYIPFENRIVTTMSQTDSRWKSNYFGDYDKPYSNSCATFVVLHIHSALSGKLYNHPDEFAEDVRANIDPSLLAQENNPTNFQNVEPFFTKLGYKTTVYEADITQEIYQAICDALARGAYVYNQVSTDNSADAGHAVAIYGINSNKEVLVLDSGTFGILTYRIPYQNLTGPSSNIVIVEKKEEA